jgi:hypothetical protein
MNPLKYLIEKKYSFNFEDRSVFPWVIGYCNFKNGVYNVLVENTAPLFIRQNIIVPKRTINPSELEDLIQSLKINITYLYEIINIEEPLTHQTLRSEYEEHNDNVPEDVFLRYIKPYEKLEIPLILDRKNLMWGNLEEKKRELSIEIAKKINNNISKVILENLLDDPIHDVRFYDNEIKEANAFIQKLKDAIVLATATITERNSFGNNISNDFDEIIRNEYYSQHPRQGIEVLEKILSDLDNIIKDQKDKLINIIKSLKKEFPNDPEFNIKYENNVITSKNIEIALYNVINKKFEKSSILKDEEKPYYRDIFLKTKILLKRSDKPTSFGKKKSKSRDPDKKRNKLRSELSYLLSL